VVLCLVVLLLALQDLREIRNLSRGLRVSRYRRRSRANEEVSRSMGRPGGNGGSPESGKGP